MADGKVKRFRVRAGALAATATLATVVAGVFAPAAQAVDPGLSMTIKGGVAKITISAGDRTLPGCVITLDGKKLPGGTFDLSPSGNKEFQANVSAGTHKASIKCAYFTDSVQASWQPGKPTTPIVDPTMGPTPIVDPTMGPTPIVDPTMGPTPIVDPTMGPTPIVDPTVAPTPIVDPTMDPKSKLGPAPGIDASDDPGSPMLALGGLVSIGAAGLSALIGRLRRN